MYNSVRLEEQTALQAGTCSFCIQCECYSKVSNSAKEIARSLLFIHSLIQPLPKAK